MKKRSAFTLLEISIVILIVGVLIAGIAQGISLIKKSKLRNAALLTVNSPVIDTPNLLAWFETSLPESFIASETVDGGAISTWYDLNRQLVSRNTATQSTSTKQPKFYENSINGGIPTIRFDGTSSYLNLDANLFGKMLVLSDYTIFVVEQKKTAFSSFGPFIGSIGGNVGGNNLNIGYNSDTQIKVGHGSGQEFTYTYSGLAYNNNPIPRIHTLRYFYSSTSASYWLNGGTTAKVTSTALGALNTFPTPTIGTFLGSVQRYFNGDIAEIIVFTRALRTEERQLIETYLSKKYGITLN